MKLKKIPLYFYQLVSGKRKLKISFVDKDANKNFADFLLNSDFKHTNTNTKFYNNIIAVDGIAACAGSSAITDFLAEFSNCTSLGGVDENENPERGQENSFEFDFFRDHNGVYELEKIADFDGNRIQQGSISDFIKLVEKNYKSGISFYGDYYLAKTQEFLNNFIEIFFYKDDYNEFFIKKVSKNEYRKLAGEYIKSLLQNIPSNENLVLDNLCSISNPKKDVLSDYFENYKVITSMRDPRDLYTSARTYPPFDLWFVPEDPYQFVKYYKWYAERYDYKSNPNVLLIKFEDFVLDYNNISSKIMKFCGLNENQHEKKMAYFNPNISKNNIGIYKKYKDQDAIKIIENELKDYLYE